MLTAYFEGGNIRVLRRGAFCRDLVLGGVGLEFFELQLHLFDQSGIRSRCIIASGCEIVVAGKTVRDLMESLSANYRNPQVSALVVPDTPLPCPQSAQWTPQINFGFKMLPLMLSVP